MSRRSFLAGGGAPASFRQVRAEGTPRSHARGSSTDFDDISLDDLAPYQPQTTCDPTPKAGVVGFQEIVLEAYSATSSYGISRDCSIGGTSEHKEGRAWDWGVAVSDPDEHAASHEVFNWLFRADADGRDFAMARRLGVTYIIHNRHIWGSYRAAEGWRPYVGANPHTDHTHFSFSWEGARKQTSYWDGSPVHYGSAA
jgi:hypothetical protein